MKGHITTFQHQTFFMDFQKESTLVINEERKEMKHEVKIIPRHRILLIIYVL